jgi:hypothetical protein
MKMAKIDEHKELADKLAELLNGQDEIEINHNECGTLVRFDNVEFSYDENGKSEGLTVSL